MRAASPIAWLPVAHAVTIAEFGPLAPKRIEIRPEAMLMISMGMKNGETRSGPLLRRTLCVSRSVLIPPMPDPTRTPNRVPSTFERSSPESSTAMTELAIAYCTKGSRRRASFLSTNFSGSNPRTSPAIRVG